MTFQALLNELSNPFTKKTSKNIVNVEIFVTFNSHRCRTDLYLSE